MRRPRPKHGELIIWHGRIDGDVPDVVYSGGEGTQRCDRSLLHFYLGSPKAELDLDAPLNSSRFAWVKYAPSLWEELEKRGYDLTTLQFYIRKKTAGEPAKLCRFCGQPMKPKGVRKRPDEYDHAQGCPYNRKKKGSR